MKKLISLVGAGALLLSVVAPVLAHSHHSSGTENIAIVENTTTAIANTGVYAGNSAVVQMAGADEVEVGGLNVVKQLSTGNADALAVGVVVANTQVGCSNCGGSSTRKNFAKVGNATVADAETGVVAGGSALVSKAHVDDVEVYGTNIVKQLHTGDAESDVYGVVVVNTRLNWHH